MQHPKWLLFLGLVACSSGAGVGSVGDAAVDHPAQPDATVPVDASVDGAFVDVVDASPLDASSDSAVDAGPMPTVPGLALWLEASMGVTKSNTNRVSGWADQSGAGNHAAQSIPMRQPSWSSSGLNGRPALRFSTSGTEISVPDAKSLQFGTGDFTLELVARFDNPPSAPCFFASKVDGDGIGIVFVANEPIDEAHGLGVFLDGTTFLAGTIAYGDDIPRLYGVRRVGSTLELRVQGVAVATLPGATVDVSALGGALTFGLLNDVGGLDGSVAEIVAVKGPITAPDLAKLEGHLGAKYGL